MSSDLPRPDHDLASVEKYLAAMPQGMGGLNEKMGVELVEVSPERVVATMPVEGNTQPYGLLHGGASVVLAETLGSIGAALHGFPDKVAVGVDINTTARRPRGGSPASPPPPTWGAAAPPGRSSSPTSAASACAPAD